MQQVSCQHFSTFIILGLPTQGLVTARACDSTGSGSVCWLPLNWGVTANRYEVSLSGWWKYSQISVMLCNFVKIIKSVQFSSVAQSCLTLCNPRYRSTPGLPVHHQLPESTQTHVHWVGDANQPSHPLSSPSPLDFNLSQHQGLSQWVGSLHQVAKVLEFQLQHQSFQWTPRTDLL